MSARFVVMLDSAPASLQNAITERMKATGYGFWKWIENAWLVDTTHAQLSAKAFSEWLRQTPGFGPKQVHLVLRVDDGSGDYHGHANQLGWPWMEKYWKGR